MHESQALQDFSPKFSGPRQVLQSFYQIDSYYLCFSEISSEDPYFDPTLRKNLFEEILQSKGIRNTSWQFRRAEEKVFSECRKVRLETFRKVWHNLKLRLNYFINVDGSRTNH